MKKQLREMDTWPEPLVDAVLDVLEAADMNAQQSNAERSITLKAALARVHNLLDG